VTLTTWREAGQAYEDRTGADGREMHEAKTGHVVGQDRWKGDY